jgi:hypothetical protein
VTAVSDRTFNRNFFRTEVSRNIRIFTFTRFQLTIEFHDDSCVQQHNRSSVLVTYVHFSTIIVSPLWAYLQYSTLQGGSFQSSVIRCHSPSPFQTSKTLVIRCTRRALSPSDHFQCRHNYFITSFNIRAPTTQVRIF